MFLNVIRKCPNSRRDTLGWRLDILNILQNGRIPVEPIGDIITPRFLTKNLNEHHKYKSIAYLSNKPKTPIISILPDKSNSFIS